MVTIAQSMMGGAPMPPPDMQQLQQQEQLQEQQQQQDQLQEQQQEQLPQLSIKEDEANDYGNNDENAANREGNE